MNVALCFPIKNCEQYLKYIFKNIENLKQNIKEITFYCIFVYDECTDKSIDILNIYKMKNPKFTILQKIENKSIHRTVRIAKARNVLLHIVYSLDNISAHIMIDTDDRCSPSWDISSIKYYLIHRFKDDDWDAMTFDRYIYYDIWALLFDNFKQHCYGFSVKNKTKEEKKRILFKIRCVMRNVLIHKLKTEKSDCITVLSAFNGFGIYKTKRFKGIFYDGFYKNVKQLFTESERHISLYIFHKLGFKDLILDDDFITCCEHIFYHVLSIKKNNCKIRISKRKVIRTNKFIQVS